jgi:hypothetical protein
MYRKITLQLWLMLVAMPFAFSQSGTLVPTFGENMIKQGAEDASEQVNLQNGLIAYYPFNGNANDESLKKMKGRCLKYRRNDQLTII